MGYKIEPLQVGDRVRIKRKEGDVFGNVVGFEIQNINNETVQKLQVLIEGSNTVIASEYSLKSAECQTTFPVGTQPAAEPEPKF